MQVHQVNLTSSDIEWAGDFSLLIPPVIQTVPTNGGPVCSNITWNLPTLKYQPSGTNIVLSWSNPITNNCGSNAVFTLQQSLELSNPSGSTPWANVSPTSPYITPKTNAMRYFRLKL